MLSIDPVDVHDNVSIFEQGSPDSLRARPLSSPPTHDQRQNSTSDRQIINAVIEDDYFDDQLKHRCSSRSSVSSFPASVIHNTPLTDYEDGDHMDPKSSGHADSPVRKPGSSAYMSAFRNPSSVRALQLGESEFTDTDVQSTAGSHRPRKSSKIPSFRTRSPASTQSSPTKRLSRPATPQLRSSSKLKKEFPLVLLHCTILSPAVSTRVPHVSEEIYEAVLPEEYKKRWRILQDKVAKNTETRQRGVLISHPHEDYELLEERLLETLELERPRIRQHHFLGTKSTDGIDSGFESSSQTEESSDSELEPKEKCPDCGKMMSCNIEQERKWMVKVYAANGLMKEGAWAAAWQEMEKVDVEVGIWMPEGVRMEVDERLTALQAQHEAEKSVDEGPPSLNRRLRSKSGRTKLRQEERMKEIYGEAGRAKTQDEIDGLTEESKSAQHKDSEAKVTLPKDEPRVSSEFSATPDRRPHVTFAPELVSRSSCNQQDISSLIQHRLKNIMQDQKSLTIILLSMIILFFTIQNTTTQTKSQVALDQAVFSPITSTRAESAIVHTIKESETSYVTTTVFATPSLTRDADTDGATTSAKAEEYHTISTAIIDDQVSNSIIPATSTTAHGEHESQQTQDHTPSINPEHNGEASTNIQTPQPETSTSMSQEEARPSDSIQSLPPSDPEDTFELLLDDHMSAIIPSQDPLNPVVDADVSATTSEQEQEHELAGLESSAERADESRDEERILDVDDIEGMNGVSNSWNDE